MEKLLILFVFLSGTIICDPQMTQLDYKAVFEAAAPYDMSIIPDLASSINFLMDKFEKKLNWYSNFQLADVKLISLTPMAQTDTSCYTYFYDQGKATITILEPFEYRFDMAWIYNWFIFPISGTVGVTGKVASLMYTVEWNLTHGVLMSGSLNLLPPDTVNEYGIFGGFVDSEKFITEIFEGNMNSLTEGIVDAFISKVKYSYTYLYADKHIGFYLPSIQNTFYLHTHIHNFQTTPQAMGAVFDQVFHSNNWNKPTGIAVEVSEQYIHLPQRRGKLNSKWESINSFRTPKIWTENIWNYDAVGQMILGVWGGSERTLWDSDIPPQIFDRLDVLTLEKLMPDVGMLFQDNPKAKVRMHLSGVPEAGQMKITLLNSSFIEVAGLHLYSSIVVGEYDLDAVYPLTITTTLKGIFRLLIRGLDVNIIPVDFKMTEYDARPMFTTIMANHLETFVNDYSRGVFTLLLADGLFGEGLRFPNTLPQPEFELISYFDPEGFRLQLAKTQLD